MSNFAMALGGRVVHMGRTLQLRKAAELSRVLEKASDLKAV
jgi:hypothetical protein